MRRFWQGVIWCCVLVCQGAWVLQAEEPAKWKWEPPKIGAGLFDDKLGMLDREREEYATNLANRAAECVVEGKGSAPSLAEARRMLALAMHLCPRNRKALVVNFQLGKGMSPTVDDDDYSAEVLARLLLTRAELLVKQGGAQNQLLARCFVELSAQLDPRNEDAIYAYELQRIDHGDMDWKLLTDAKPQADGGNGEEGKPAPVPAPGPDPGARPGPGPGAKPGPGPGGKPGPDPGAKPGPPRPGPPVRRTD